jgi:hypothetical protein
MSGGIGYHLQWSWSTAEFKATAEAYIRDHQPAAMVLFDSHGNAASDALRLARTYPLTVFIYRKYIQGDNQYTYLSPSAWCAEHAALIDGPPNLFSQIDNEPNAGASAAWMLATMKLARALHIRAGVGGYGVGQPSEAEMELQSIADIVTYMAAHPRWFVLLVHEYTRGSVFVDFARHVRDPRDWPAVVPAGATLHLMGRYKAWHRLADKLRVARPKVVVSEFGYDYVDAVPPDAYGPIGSLLSSLPTWAGWSALRPEVYGARMLQRAKELFYSDPDVLGWVVFCWSDHPTDWTEWNADLADEFRAELEKGFDMTTPTPTYTPYAVRTYTLVGNGVRVRSSADTSAPIVTTVNSGATVKVLSTAIPANDGYGWQEVEANGKRGWMALRGASVTWSLTPVVIDPEAERKAQLLKWAGELEIIAAEMRSAAQ